jgi:hypothetical protein
MQFRPTTLPTAVEEAFARALRIRLKQEPDCCFKDHRENSAKAITLVNEKTGVTHAFHSIYAATQFIGIDAGWITPETKRIKNWKIERF